jgi:hypothetical protein
LYRRRDVETLLEIKRLLHTERFTIEGAKRRLKIPTVAAPAATREQMNLPLGERTYREALVRLKKEVEDLYKLLS